MTFIFEANDPFQLKPGIYKSEAMTRVWWLWFGFTFTKLSSHEMFTGKYVWENPTKEGK